MTEDLTREELTEAIDVVVVQLLDAAGCHEPPVDALTLARRHLGLVIPTEANTTGRGRTARREVSAERQQWTTAQEIARHFKSRILEELGLPADQPAPLLGESLANLFAFRLLAPTTWFADAARTCGYDLFALKERFATAGHEILAWRMLDLSEPCVITILDNGSIVRRKGNAFRPPKGLARAESACVEHVHEYSRPFEVSRDGWSVQGWPVHTVDWRREILRSVVDEDALVDSDTHGG